MPKYPDVNVALVGEDGNAFSILGRVSSALKRGGHGDAVEEFHAEATSGDYNHLLQTVMEYVSTDEDNEDEDEDDDEVDGDFIMGLRGE